MSVSSISRANSNEDLKQKPNDKASAQMRWRGRYWKRKLEEKLRLEDQNGSSGLPRVLASNLPIRDRPREAECLRTHRDEYAD